MFEAFYKLSTNPFRLTPDPKFCFHHPSYDQAYAYLQYALKQGEGFVMVTGRPGIGKTTLVKTFLVELQEPNVITARIAAANVEATDLLCVVAHAYGVDYDHTSKASLLLRLEEFFTRQARTGNRVLLIVDEAQGLPHSALEELRLLADLQLGSQPLLQLFLVGQEKLRELMREPEMEQFQQRVIGACHLDPLDLGETRAYIEHRLHKADWKGDPEMSGGALLAVFQYSKGIPRHINKICTRLLLDGFMKESHEVSKEDATTVADELRSEELAPLENPENAAIDCSYDEDDELTINDLSLRMNQQQVEQAEAGQAANEAEQGASSCDQIMARASSAVQPQWNREMQNPVDSPTLHNGQSQTGIRAFSDPLHNQPGRGRAPVTPLKTSTQKQHTQRRPRSNGVTQKGIHQKKKHAWQPKLLALTAALGGYAANAARLLADRIKRTERPSLWGAAVAVVVLIVAIIAANFSDSGNDQPAPPDQQTLALNQTNTPQPATLAAQEKQPLPTALPPEEPVPEQKNSAERHSSDNAADSKISARERVAAAPVSESRKPPEPQPEPVRTAISPPSTAFPATSADTDTVAAPDSNTVKNAHEPIPDLDPPATAQQAAPVVAPPPPVKIEKTAPPTVKPAPAKKVTAAPSASREEKITQLLAHGWRSLRRDRLLIPKNNNAYHYFQLVLKQDPGNSDALYGLDRIVARYTTLASTALDNNDRKKAERYIARGFRVNPDSMELRALRDRMNAPVTKVVSEPPPVAAAAAPEPEPVDFMTRFKAFLKTPPNNKLLKPGLATDEP